MTGSPREEEVSLRCGISFTRQQTGIAAMLFLMMLLNYLDRVILSLISPLLRKELNLTPVDYAFAVNAFLMAYAVMYVGSGLFVDRVGSRLGLAISVALWSIASSLHAGISSMKGLLTCRVLLGTTEPGGWTGAVKTTSETFAPSQRGIVCGIFTSGAGVGALVAPPIVVWLSLHFGWRSTFLVSGIAGLFWTPVWLMLTRNPPAKFVAERTISFRERLRWIARNPRSLSYVGTRFFGDTSSYFFLFWLPEYLVTAKGFTFGSVGALGWIPFCGIDVGALIGGYASGRLIRRWGNPVTSRKIVMTCAALFVLAGTLLQHGSTVPAVLVSVSLCTFGAGVWASNMHSVAADAFPEQVVATVHGLAGSAGAIGGVLFNTMVGYLAARGRYAWVFAVLVLLQPLGVGLLWIWLPAHLKKPAGENRPAD